MLNTETSFIDSKGTREQINWWFCLHFHVLHDVHRQLIRPIYCNLVAAFVLMAPCHFRDSGRRVDTGRAALSRVYETRLYFDSTLSP